MHSFFFFFNDTATTEIYTLSLHDALPIFSVNNDSSSLFRSDSGYFVDIKLVDIDNFLADQGIKHIDLIKINIEGAEYRDRKSTRLNSSHSQISYAVFCLKKKKKVTDHTTG